MRLQSTYKKLKVEDIDIHLLFLRREKKYNNNNYQRLFKFIQFKQFQLKNFLQLNIANMMITVRNQTLPRNAMAELGEGVVVVVVGGGSEQSDFMLESKGKSVTA